MIALAILALILSLVVGVPLIIFGGFGLLYVTGARGRLALSNDTFACLAFMGVGITFIALAALNLGTHL